MVKRIVNRLGVYAAVLLIIAMLVVAALTLLGPMIGNMFMFGWNWVTPGSLAENIQALAWASDAAPTPDGRRIVAIEPNDPEAPRQDMCPTRLRVRDAASKRILAELACQDFIYTWQADRIAWVDSSTIAVDSSGGAVFLWKWRMFRFPFGAFWLTVEGLVAGLAGLIVLLSRRRLRRAATSPQEIESGPAHPGI